MSFDYTSSDRQRDRDHSDRRGGDRDEFSGSGSRHTGYREAVHDSYERDRENEREAGYGNPEGGYGRGGYERGGEDGGRGSEGYGTGYGRRREEEREGEGYGDRYNDRERDEGYNRDSHRGNDYNRNDRRGDYGNDRRQDPHDDNSHSSTITNNHSRDTTASIKDPGGSLNWQSIGTKVATAGIEHFVKSYEKASEIQEERERRIDGADGMRGKESAFAKRLGEKKKTEGENLGNQGGELKDKLGWGGV